MGLFCQEHPHFKGTDFKIVQDVNIRHAIEMLRSLPSIIRMLPQRKKILHFYIFLPVSTYMS